MLLHQGMGLGQCLEAVFCVAQVVRDFRQQGAQVWDGQRCPGGSPGGDPLAYLGHPLLALALHGQRPPTEARSQGHPEWKSLLSRERDGGLCVLVHGRHVAAKLIDEGRPTSRRRQTKGMRQLVCQRQGIVEAGQGLLRVPQQPEGHSGIDSAGNTRIGAHAEHRGTALVWRVACDAFLQVHAGSRQRAKPEPRHPKGIVGDDRERGVVRHVAPGAARFPRAHVPCVTVAVQYKTATDQTGPGQALASRPPADTTRMPGCRRAPPRALSALWPSAVPRRGRCAGLRRAGYAQASLAGS